MSDRKRKRGLTHPLEDDSGKVVLTSSDLYNQGLLTVGGGHLEVREHQDKSWTIHWPQEGWIPCPPDCNLRHRGGKHDTERPWDTAHDSYASPEEAYEAAQVYAAGREIRVITYFPPGQRRKQEKPTSFICDGCQEEAAVGTGAKMVVRYNDRRPTVTLATKTFELCDRCAEAAPGVLKLPRS